MTFLMSLDSGILLFLQEHVRSELWTPFWTGITFLAEGGWMWIVLSLALLIPRRTRTTGITALISMAVGFLFTNLILKNLVARIRPYDAIDALTILVSPLRDYSFPSGHTTVSFSCAMVLFLTLPRRYGIPALVPAVLIAFSRLYVGVHYPTDVLGGMLIGIFAAAMTVYAVKRYCMQKSHNISSM